MCIRSFKRLAQSQSGNVAHIFAIMALPTLLVIGGAIDSLRISGARAKLQSSVESGVLSAASLTSTQAVEDAVSEYILANLGDDVLTDNLDIQVVNQEVSINSRKIEVEVTSKLPLSFFRLIGHSEKAITVSAEAVEARTTTELSMVLDISSSMRGDKLTALKGAASDFVDQILNPQQIDVTSINLVPFGGTVNLGDYFDDVVVNLSVTPASGATVTVDPSESQYDISQSKLDKTKSFLFPNHLDASGAPMNTCVEVIEDDFDLDLIPENSRSQTPHFWKWTNFNPWCPEAESTALFNTNDPDDLKDRINEMTLSDGTGMDHGLLWGAKALSPAYKGKLGGDFAERPSDFNDPANLTQKIMVLMTDGAITAQFRPEDYTWLSTHNHHKKKNNKNQQTLLSKGSNSHTSDNYSAVGNFKKVCDDLRDQGVIIYTIGFKISENSLPENLLKYCATNPANYYLVENLDIAAAFNAIAASVQNLRVSG